MSLVTDMQSAGIGESEPRRARIGELYAAVAEAKAGEAAAQEQLEAAQSEAETLRQRLAAVGVPATELEDTPAPVAEQPATRHLVFAITGAAYELVELAGPPPAPGDVVELESRRHLVMRVGPSPLAGSRLRCAYTIPA